MNTERHSDVTPGGMIWIHNEYFRIWYEWNEMKLSGQWMKWKIFWQTDKQAGTEQFKYWGHSVDTWGSGPI